MPGLKILITSGATREPIDDVRYISNISTGKTGARLADLFSIAGFDVTYLRGEGAAEPVCECELFAFLDYKSLDSLLRERLGAENYFAVIHLAAVADYSVASVLVGGRSFLPSDLKKTDSGEELVLVLKRNAKILDKIKSYASTAPVVIGFKLTHSLDSNEVATAVAKLAASKNVDAIVHNDLSQIREETIHKFQIFKTRAGLVAPGRECAGTDELGAALVETFREYL